MNPITLCTTYKYMPTCLVPEKMYDHDKMTFSLYLFFPYIFPFNILRDDQTD